MRDIKVSLNERELTILINALNGPAATKAQNKLRERLVSVLDFVTGAQRELENLR